MSERKPEVDRTSFPANREDPEEERLRALFATAFPPLKLTAALREQMAEEIGRRNAPVAQRRGGWPLPNGGRFAAAAIATALLLAVLGITLVRMGHGRLPGQPAPSVVTMPPSEPPVPRRVSPSSLHDHGQQIATQDLVSPRPHGDGSPRFRSSSSGAGVRTPGPHAEGPGMRTGGPHSGNLPTLFSGSQPLCPHHQATVRDDLAFVNPAPGAGEPQWLRVPRDEWEPGARVHPIVRVRDDFVTIPFPRVATRSNQQIAEAVESYKREAAIVDPRLAREVTCAFKGTALSDLCDRLRTDTGIQLTAGPSVADEKVTLLCEKLPLREVMRQLSRPFGYTWLRSRQGLERQGLGVGSWGLGTTESKAPRPLSAPNPQLPTPNPRAASSQLPTPAYRYELAQDLKSQLLEEELENRDRDAALLDLEKEIDRYRPYLGLSPDEALAQARTAAPEEKKLLENLAGWGWGPLQLYARLSPQEQAALRAGQTLSFSGDPQRIARDGAQSLPPELERGVLQSGRDLRVRRPGGQTSSARVIGRAQDLPEGVPPAASPEANGFVSLRIGHSELGQFTFDGGSGVTVGDYITVRGHDGDLARGVSPAVQDPKNEIANAPLAHDPALQRQVTVAPQRDLTPQPPSLQGKGESPGLTSDHGSASPRPPSPSRGGAGGGVGTEPKVTTADVLEAIHRASGMPIVADFYTRLYPQESVTVKGQSLFEALNHLADAMHLRWNKEGNWLRFRSISYYDDRVKEVPNRLLTRWAAARRQHNGLPLDELIEMAQLSDAQLHSSFVAEGVKECWGLEEWGLASNHEGRPHLLYLAQLTPAQRQRAMSAAGLAFTELSLAQQQGLIAHLGERLRSLEEVAGATLRVEYSQPGGFRWPAGEMPAPGQPGLFGLSRVREPTRAAALSAARLLDAGASETQIAPTDLSLAVVYTLVDPKTGKPREQGVRAYADGHARMRW